MTKYFALVKLLFTQQYKTRDALGGKNKKKRGGWIITIILLALCFLPFIAGIIVAMYYMGQMSHGNVYVGTFLMLICQGLVMMFGVHSVISNVFVVKDADKLEYLPIRNITVFLAKFTVTYINEIITTAITVCVVLLPFGIGAGASAAFYAALPFALLFIPVLPLFVGTIIAMPLSALIAAINKNGVLKTVLRVLVYVAVMALYMFVMYKFGFLTGAEDGNILDDPQGYISEMIEGFIERLQNAVVYFNADYMLSQAMFAQSFGNWIGYFAASLGENALMLALIGLISAPFYRWIALRSLEEGGSARRKSAARSVQFKKKGLLRQLAVADAKRIVRDGQMGFQSFAGIIVIPFILVIFYFMMGRSIDGDASFLEIMSISPLYQIVAPLVILGYIGMLGITTNVLGAYPISRENNAFYILKTLPISFGKILLAKVILATAVMSVCDFVTCVLIVALLKIKWYYGIAIFATMVFIGFGAMSITTLLDLKSPRFGSFGNTARSLHNAKNSWLAMLIGWLCSIAVAVIAVPFSLWYYAAMQKTDAQSIASIWYIPFVMWMLILACAFVFALVAYKIMTNKAARYFERIEV